MIDDMKRKLREKVPKPSCKELFKNITETLTTDVCFLHLEKQLTIQNLLMNLFFLK